MVTMKRLIAAAALAAACLAQGGCLTSALAKDPTGTIKALGEAGCSGTLKVGGHAATASGVSFGSASGDVDFTGTCDPSKVQPRPATPPSAPSPTG